MDVTTRSLASKYTPRLWLDRRRSHCWALLEQSHGWERDTETSLLLRYRVSTSIPPAEGPLPRTLAGRRTGHLDSGQMNSQSTTLGGPGCPEWQESHRRDKRDEEVQHRLTRQPTLPLCPEGSAASRKDTAL